MNKKTLLSLTLALFICTFNLYAQELRVEIKNNGEVKEEIFDLPSSMTYPLDSLLSEWKVKNYLLTDESCSTAETSPLFSDSVYIDRLSRIPSIMEMPYNEVVRAFIDMYANRLRHQVSFMLSAGNFYIPIFEEALDAYNLPLELKYLPVIESALNPTAVSRAGAVGLWQFMIGTGKIYGLESNSLVDDRRDPIKSSWAAARYLNELYEIYKDWNLVIAAYNCGPGNINKAIRRSGGETDYWKIYNFLPKETRGYVPAFIAANYIMTYYCDHKICPMETNIPADTDTIQISKKLHLKQVAELCNIDLEQLKSLNPQYKKEVIPANSTKQYSLRLPLNQISSFIDVQDSIYDYKATEFFTNRAIVQTQTKSNNTTGNKNTPTYYKIRNGDSLSKIASKFGVSVRNLKRWNNLRSDRISAGKRLKIYK